MLAGTYINKCSSTGRILFEAVDWKLENRNEDATIVFQNRSQYECGLSMVVSDNGAAWSE